MPDLPRPDNVLTLLRVAPRLAAAALRLTGATLRGVADLIDPGHGGDGADLTDRPPNGRGSGAEPSTDDADGDRLWDQRDEAPSRPPPPPAPEPSPPPPPLEDQAAGQPSAAGAPPEHVSEDAVLVAEAADAGAEQGPGPEIHVEEPWPGYSEMTAPDVIDRLTAESTEALALIELYERTHRARRSVLQAAERELRRRGGPAAQPSQSDKEASE
jgi:hypothetical protein